MKLRVMAHPRDKFAGRYRLGRFFASGKWEELDATPAEAEALRADKRLLVEDAEPAPKAKGPAPKAEG